MNLMKIKFKTGLAFLCFTFLSSDIAAQTSDWKTEHTAHDKITVKYRISERTDTSGQKVPLVEYTATTIDTVPLQNCISLMKNISKHKDFTGDKTSEIVRNISENEWIVRYFSTAPWPLENFDCVSKMTFVEDAITKTAVFTLAAVPSESKYTNLKHVTFCNVKYLFKEIDNRTVEIEVSAEMSPAIKVSLWMIKASFPNAPTRVIQNIVKLAKLIQ